MSGSDSLDKYNFDTDHFAYYFLSVKDFSTIFLPTGITDLIWGILILVFALLSNEVRFRDLFLPITEDIIY